MQMQLKLGIKLLPLIGLLIVLGACQPAPQPLPTEGQNPASPAEAENESADDEDNNENQQKDEKDEDEEDEKSEDKD